MKNSFRFSLICLGLILCLFLSACSDALVVPTAESVSTTTKKEADVKAPDALWQQDPKEDGILQVLMIGNSSSYYYVEELYGLAQAAGIKMKVCNVYYSGCRLSQHWNWFETGEANYKFYITDHRGRTGRDSYTLQNCLNYANWDVISLQQGFINHLDSQEKANDSCEPYLGNLLREIKKLFPLADYYWHQTWAYQIGYNKTNGAILDVAAQEQMHAITRGAALAVCQKYGLTRVPSGDAWQEARKDPVVGDHLCGRYGNLQGDYYHDGDIGGGQYLNACVWFEVLTGQSCVGNSYRPTEYSLPEEKVIALQNAAHRAVTASKSEVLS